jgi:hypothetical protein
MRSLFFVLAACLWMGTGPASARIRIIDSVYADGMLTVSGRSLPGRTVTLDGKYKTTADSDGRFKFHVKYKPDTCMSEIDTGEDAYSTVITNCFLDDAAASTKQSNEASTAKQ